MRADFPAPAFAPSPHPGSHSPRAAWAESLQATAKAIQHANAVFQPHYAAALSIAAHRRARGKGKLRLRIIRMHKKGRASVDVVLQQPHTFIGRIPALDDDVVQFVAEKFVHDLFILTIHLKEVGQSPRGRQRTA